MDKLELWQVGETLKQKPFARYYRSPKNENMSF